MVESTDVEDETDVNEPFRDSTVENAKDGALEAGSELELSVSITGGIEVNMCGENSRWIAHWLQLKKGNSRSAMR